jgi:hypothetical protein
VKKRDRNRTPHQQQSEVIMGLDHPLMTPERAAELLGNSDIPGFTFSFIRRLGALCNPVVARSLPVGDVLAIGDELNAKLDAALLAAQKRPADASSPKAS